MSQILKPASFIPPKRQSDSLQVSTTPITINSAATLSTASAPTPTVPTLPHTFAWKPPTFTPGTTSSDLPASHFLTLQSPCLDNIARSSVSSFIRNAFEQRERRLMEERTKHIEVVIESPIVVSDPASPWSSISPPTRPAPAATGHSTKPKEPSKSVRQSKGVKSSKMGAANLQSSRKQSSKPTTQTVSKNPRRPGPIDTAPKSHHSPVRSHSISHRGHPKASTPSTHLPKTKASYDYEKREKLAAQYIASSGRSRKRPRSPKLERKELKRRRSTGVPRQMGSPIVVD